MRSRTVVQVFAHGGLEVPGCLEVLDASCCDGGPMMGGGTSREVRIVGPQLLVPVRWRRDS